MGWMEGKTGKESERKELATEPNTRSKPFPVLVARHEKNPNTGWTCCIIVDANTGLYTCLHLLICWAVLFERA